MNETPSPSISPRVQRWLAALSLTVILTALLANARDHYLMDFISFWAAAKLAVGGSAAQAYDVAAHHAMQVQAFPADTLLPFAYPPPFLFVIAPFGWLPYSIAAPLWIIVTLLAFALAVRSLTPTHVALALAFPAAALCAITGQNGLLTAALFLCGMALLPSRPLLAGAVLGCLVIKPQLGLLLPLALIAAREWRAFAGAAVSVTVLCLASALTFGIDAWDGFFDQLGMMGSIATDNLVGWEKMASVYAGLRLIGAPDTLAWAAHLAIAAAGAALTWQVWRTTSDPLTRAAILAPASLLISPYLYIYDQVWLVASCAWLARERANRWAILALMSIPIASAVQFGSSAALVNPAPLLTIALLGLVAVRQPWVPRREHPHRHDLRTAQSSR